MEKLTLRTTVGGKFDASALLAALERHGPFEPSTDYEIAIDVVRPDAPAADAPSPRRGKKAAAEEVE